MTQQLRGERRRPSHPHRPLDAQNSSPPSLSLSRYPKVHVPHPALPARPPPREAARLTACSFVAPQEVEENAARRDATAAALEFRLAALRRRRRRARNRGARRRRRRRRRRSEPAAGVERRRRRAHKLDGEGGGGTRSARAATAEAMEAERAAALGAPRESGGGARGGAGDGGGARWGPLQHMVTKLMKQCADQGAAAAAALEEMQTKFNALTISYSDTVARLQVTEEEKTALQAKVDEVTAAMEAERQRQQEESSALNEELEAHQASLAQVMVESRAKSTLLSGAIDAGNAGARGAGGGGRGGGGGGGGAGACRENELEAAEGERPSCVVSMSRWKV